MKSNRFACVALLFVRTIVLAQSNPVPLVNNPLVPDAVAPGSPGFTLTVNGTGFVPSSVVNWNKNTLATTFISGSQLTATVPAANIATASTASVTVGNPAPGGGVSSVVFFPITVPTAGIAFGQSVLSGGSFPDAVLTADLNGDGKLDLITAQGTGSAVSVFLGNGDGTFRPRVDYVVGAYPSLTVAADFNGDGKLDLAVANGNGGAYILLGNGDGTFQPYQSFSVASTVYYLVAGDFNADGKIDLAFATYPNSVAIVLGNGDGTFESPVGYTVGSGGLFGLATGDFNRDGKLDLAVEVNFDSVVTILLGNGDGTFQPGAQLATASRPESVITADLNGDGKLDLAVTALGPGSRGALSVLLGNGDGTFQNHVDYLTRGIAVPLTAVDLNGDGKLDVAATNTARNVIFTYLGNGDGTFQSAVFFPAGSGVFGLAAGDLNGDGRLDLVTANANDNTISVLPQVASVLSTTFIDFGKTKVGTMSRTVKVTLSNTGTVAFAISSIRLTGSNASQFKERNQCGSSLAAGASCAIQVAFAPSLTKPASATVTIIDSAVNQPQTILLQGKGTQ